MSFDNPIEVGDVIYIKEFSTTPQEYTVTRNIGIIDDIVDYPLLRIVPDIEYSNISAPLSIFYHPVIRLWLVVNSSSKHPSHIDHNRIVYHQSDEEYKDVLLLKRSQYIGGRIYFIGPGFIEEITSEKCVDCGDSGKKTLKVPVAAMLKYVPLDRPEIKNTYQKFLSRGYSDTDYEDFIHGIDFSISFVLGHSDELENQLEATIWYTDGSWSELWLTNRVYPDYVWQHHTCDDSCETFFKRPEIPPECGGDSLTKSSRKQ